MRCNTLRLSDMKHLQIICVLVNVVLATGCMPTDFRDAIEWKIDQDRATDAKSQSVKGKAFLRVDDYLLDRMTAVEKLPAEQVRPRMVESIEQCHLLALQSADLEIDHLSNAAIDELWLKFFHQKAVKGDRRTEIRKRYLQLLGDTYKDFAQGLTEASTEQLRKTARLICAAARPSIKNRRGNEPVMQILRASHPTRPVPTGFVAPRVIVYEFGQLVKGQFRSDFDDSHKLEMLQRYAPRILQQTPTQQATYSPTCDQIGTVELHGSREHIEVSVQTGQPSVYAYFRNAVVRNRDHPQLVYCYWYPEHPASRPGDPEAGPVDGATIRITLDSKQRPAIIEAVQNCGCHYRCFAARELDACAAREFGVSADESLSSLTRSGSGGIEIIVEDLFDLPDGEVRSPNILAPAAIHVPIGVTFDDSIISGRTIVASRPYVLHPYEFLENMPTAFGRASMFGADGLVHNAGRAEGWLLAGTGMLSAGQPRQRGTQLICWDKRSFDDPHLLETSLRLPSDF